MRTVGLFIPEAPPERDGAFDFEKMTVEQLKEYAKEHGIDISATKVKADIITAITAAEG